MGTPDFSVPALRAVAERCDVTLVVTQPDRPRGRGRQMAESEVAAAARELGLPVLKPEDMKTEEVFAILSAQNADAFAVVAFGAILTPRVLALPRAGCLNLHGSLLPDYRGASPVQRALWDGRTETGVCTIFMDEGIDTGDIVLTHREPIRDDDDAASLAARLAEAGGPLLAGSVVLAHEGRAMRSKQDRTAGSYAKKLKKSDGIVDWSLAAREVWCHARAVTPWPGATAMHDGKRLLVVRSQVVAGQGKPGTVLAVEHEGVAVACGTDALRLIRVKPEGRAEMAASEWARGARVSLGDHVMHTKESLS
jgi:methionyl-tRNA formyltransferase